MTGYDILADCRARLADNEDLAFSEADVLRFLNDAVRDLSQSGCIQYVEDLDSSGSAITIPTEAGAIEVLRVDSSTGKLAYAPLNDPNARKTTSLVSPQSWTFWANTIYLDGAQPDTFTVWYTMVPADQEHLQNELNAQLNQYRHALAAYVEWRCRKQNDDPLANQAETEYAQIKATATAIARARFVGGTQ